MLQKFHEQNRELIVNINGRLVHRDEAGVSPFDSVVQGGDAVWEGLRVYQGRIFKLYEHLDRLRHSALALAFAEIPSHEEIVTEIRRTLEANNFHDNVHIRLTLTRGVKVTSGMDPRLNQSGPTLIVLAEYKPPVYGSDGITLATSSVRRFPPDCLDPKIHHNNLLQSILAKIEANAGRCRRCADARHAGLRGGDERDACVCRGAGCCDDEPCGGVSGRHHSGDGAVAVPRTRHPVCGTGLFPGGAVPCGGSVLHGDNGGAGAGRPG